MRSSSRRSLLKAALMALVLTTSGLGGCEVVVSYTGTLVVTNDITWSGVGYSIDQVFVGRTESGAFASGDRLSYTLEWGDSLVMPLTDTGDWVVIVRDTGGYYYTVHNVTVYSDLTSEIYIGQADYDAELTDSFGGTGAVATTGSLRVVNDIDFGDSGDYSLVEIWTSPASAGVWTEQLGGLATVGWFEAAEILDMPPGSYDVAAQDVAGNWYTVYGISIASDTQSELTLVVSDIDHSFSL